MCTVNIKHCKTIFPTIQVTSALFLIGIETQLILLIILYYFRNCRIGSWNIYFIFLTFVLVSNTRLKILLNDLNHLKDIDHNDVLLFFYWTAQIAILPL